MPETAVNDAVVHEVFDAVQHEGVNANRGENDDNKDTERDETGGRGRIRCVKWDDSARVFLDAAKLNKSVYQKYAIKQERCDASEYTQDVGFFPLKFEYKVRDGGNGVEVLASGVTHNGTTACVRVVDFHPRMYVSIPPRWIEEARRAGCSLRALMEACYRAFDDALAAHIAENPKLTARFAKLKGKYTHDLFCTGEYDMDGGERVKPWVDAKDAVGYDGNVVHKMLRLDFTSPQLVSVARELWMAPTGVPERVCAICHRGFEPREEGQNTSQSFGHRGRCKARYHRMCISKWFVHERIRRSYEPSTSVFECEALQGDEWDVNVRDDVDCEIDPDEACIRNEFVSAMKLWTYDENAETPARRKRRAIREALGLEVSDVTQGRCAEQRLCMKSVERCTAAELRNGCLSAEFLQANTMTSLGSCYCCRSKIYELVGMDEADVAKRMRERGRNEIEKAWRNVQYSLSDWWSTKLQPRLRSLGLGHLKPEPVDMHGEEETIMARLTHTMAPLPRFTVFNSNIDFRVVFFTGAKLAPCTWWLLQRRHLNIVELRERGRVTTCPLEMVIDYRSVLDLKTYIEGLTLRGTVAEATLERLRQIEHSEPEFVEMCVDCEMLPGTAKYKNADGTIRDTLHGSGFPTCDKNPVIQIGVYMYNHKTKQTRRVVFTLHEVQRDTQVMRKFMQETAVLCHSTELKMLSAFVDFVNSLRPNVLSSYNGNSFDFPYVVNRCHRLGVNAGRYLASTIRGKAVHWTESLSRSKVTTDFRTGGTMVIDYLYYAWLYFGKMRVYTLNSVAADKLGESKMDMDYTKIPLHHMSPQGRALLAQYVARDAELPLRIGVKVKAMACMFGFASLAHATAETQLTKGTQYRVLAYLYDQFVVRGIKYNGVPYMIPTREAHVAPPDSFSKQKYKGAIVFKPKRGFYHVAYPQMLQDADTLPSQDDLAALLYNDRARVEESGSSQGELAECSVVVDDGHDTGRRPRRQQLDRASDIGHPGAIATLDYKSLYPSVIRLANLCLTTLLTPFRMWKHGLRTFRYPFIHPDDVVYGTTRKHEVLVDAQGHETSWPTLDVPFRSELQQAVQLGELDDMSARVTRPDLRQLYRSVCGVWVRPDFAFETERNVIRLTYNDNNPMFVTKRIRRGVIAEAQGDLYAYRNEVRAQSKPLEAQRREAQKAMKLASGATHETLRKRVDDLDFEISRIDALQAAMKLLMNSIYGFCGAEESVLAAMALAETITLVGQYLVMSAAIITQIHGSRENGYPGNFVIVYGDTDSVFIYMRADDPSVNSKVFCINVGKYMCRLVNKSFYGGAITLEFEKIFIWILLIAPKYYIGKMLECNGRLTTVIKGVRARRRDSRRVEVLAMNEVIDHIQRLDLMGAIDCVGDWLERLHTYSVPLSWVSQSQSFSKRLDDPNLVPTKATVVANKIHQRTGRLMMPGDRLEIVAIEPEYEARVSSGGRALAFKEKSIRERQEDVEYATEHRLRYDRRTCEISLIQTMLDIMVCIVPRSKSSAGDCAEGTIDTKRNLEYLLKRWYSRPCYKRKDIRIAARPGTVAAMFAKKHPVCMQCRALIPSDSRVEYDSPYSREEQAHNELHALRKRAGVRWRNDATYKLQQRAREHMVIEYEEPVDSTERKSPLAQAASDSPQHETQDMWADELSNLFVDDMQCDDSEASCSDEETHTTGAQGRHRRARARTSMTWIPEEGVAVASYVTRRRVPLQVRQHVVAPHGDGEHSAPPSKLAALNVCSMCVYDAIRADPEAVASLATAVGVEVDALDAAAYRRTVRLGVVTDMHGSAAPPTADEWMVAVAPRAKQKQAQGEWVTMRVQVGEAAVFTPASARLHNSITKNASHWAACSACMSTNIADGDVMGCSTRECDINGLREFTRMQIERQRHAAMRFRCEGAWSV